LIAADAGIAITTAARARKEKAARFSLFEEWSSTGAECGVARVFRKEAFIFVRLSEVADFS
jgi:hypothetical protein